MRNKTINRLILLFLFTLGLFSIAIAGIVNTDIKHPDNQKLKIDGIWVGKGNVTLIKQFDGYVILQGKDEMSTWHAKGVINNNTVTCRGSGESSNGKHFIYESTLTFKNNRLNDLWKVTYAKDIKVTGNDSLVKLTTPSLKFNTR